MTQTETQPKARHEAGSCIAIAISPEAEAWSRQAQARQASPEVVATMISPEAERYSRQATLEHHLANVRIAEQQFRAVVWNLLVALASDHNGPREDKPEVVVARWGYPSAYGSLEHDGLGYRVGSALLAAHKNVEFHEHRFTAEQVTSVTEANGFITLNIS